MHRTLHNIRTIAPGLTLFLLLLLTHLFFITRGISHAILDRHEFRQTQTAITAWCFVRDGYTLNYITPVLGTPWTIPFEFPLYQMLVAFFCKLTHTPLDVAGRVVSISFFYLCLPLIWYILRLLGIERKNAWYVLCFVLLNTTLLFWSRTFMIESTALFFSLMYIACVLTALKLFTERRLGVLLFLLLAIACGALAALVKVTTFTVYLMVTVIILLNALLQLHRQKDRARLARLVSSFWGLLLLPIMAIYLWTLHADHKKSLSYLGSFYTSASLSKWNFGTWVQRTSPAKLMYIAKNACYAPYGAIIVVVLSAILPLRYKRLILAAAIPYFAIFFIFTNLYYIHDYYGYANTILFSVMAGLFFISIFSLPNIMGKLALSGVSLFLAVGSIYYYFTTYYPVQKRGNADLTAGTDSLKKIIGKEDVLMVIGTDWSSEIPYYTERKAVCLPEGAVDSMDINKEDIAISVNHILDKINTHIDDFVVIHDYVTDRDRKIVDYYHLNPEPVTMKYGERNVFVFLKK